VEIDLGLRLGTVNDTHVSPKITTILSGHPRYLPNSAIISNLPSAQTVNCQPDPKKPGLVACEWNSGPELLPVPGHWNNGWRGDKMTSTYFDASVSRTGPSSARIKVKGVNTRSCRLYFDNQPIVAYTVYPSGGAVGEQKGMQFGYDIRKKGIDNLRLWSRTWDREFVVDVHSVSTLRLEGRIACQWTEYESAVIDHGSVVVVVGSPEGEEEEEEEERKKGSVYSGGKIPAFEEVLRFLPEWAVATTTADGLVEVVAPFSI